MPEERAQAESPPTAADDAADGRLEALFSPSDQADADGLDQLHQPAAAEPGTDEREPAQKGGSAIGQPSGSQPTTLPPPSGSSDGGGKAKQRGWISLAVPRHRRGMTRRESAHFWRISRQRHNTFAHTRCPLVTRGAGSSIRWPGYGHHLLDADMLPSRVAGPSTPERVHRAGLTPHPRTTRYGRLD